MQQMYSCPKCGAPVAYGIKFCGNCGGTLNWVTQQMSPPLSPPPGYQYPNQQQTSGQQRPPANQQPGWGQQPAWNQPAPPNQPPGWVNQNQYQQRPAYGYGGAMPKKNSFSLVIMVMVIVIIVLFTIGGVGVATNGKFFTSGGQSTQSPTPTTPPAAVTPPSTTPATPVTPPAAPQGPELPASQATKITAAELIAAYTNDSTTAIATYQGTRYAISCTISDISPPLLYVNGGSAGTVEIEFIFSQGSATTETLWSLNKGQSVTVEGRIYSFQQGIIVADDSRLVK